MPAKLYSQGCMLNSPSAVSMFQFDKLLQMYINLHDKIRSRKRRQNWKTNIFFLFTINLQNFLLFPLSPHHDQKSYSMRQFSTWKSLKISSSLKRNKMSLHASKRIPVSWVLVSWYREWATGFMEQQTQNNIPKELKKAEKELALTDHAPHYPHLSKPNTHPTSLCPLYCLTIKVNQLFSSSFPHKTLSHLVILPVGIR